MATSRSSSSLLAGTSKDSGPPVAGRNCFQGTRLMAGDLPWPPAAGLLAPLGAWFASCRRDLPWRAKDLSAPHPDPYAVLVSELMLQQTQVATVIPYFGRWMRAFPDARSLASASEDDLHRHWQGLGYYRRARHLQGAAQSIAERGWPQDLEGLLRLPGLGPYSAAAVAAIAFQAPEPALDGNALRVAARLLALEDPKLRQAELRDWLRPALARLGPSATTQAIMELGALVCLPRQPRCEACPLAAGCGARSRGLIALCPGSRPRPVPRIVDLWLVAAVSGGRWLLERPASRGLLAGLWKWPTAPGLETCAGEAPSADAAVAQASIGPGWVQSYTHRKERITPCLVEVPAPWEPGVGQAWIDTADLRALPLGRRDQRLRELVLEAPSSGLGTATPAAPLLALFRQSGS